MDQTPQREAGREWSWEELYHVWDNQRRQRAKEIETDETEGFKKKKKGDSFVLNLHQ